MADNNAIPSVSAENNYVKYSKINTRSPIVCKVRHTISVVDDGPMSLNYIIRSIFVFLFLAASTIGSIMACITSQRVRPFVAIPPDGPVNGRWSSWSYWSRCSITCSSEEQKYGNMTRTRYCNSPPPQLNGTICIGESIDHQTCFNKQCPFPIDGNWIEWTEWSSCSKTCKDMQSAPLQSRSRKCSDPPPKDGGKDCDGESENQRFCDWLPQCPVDGQWGRWHIAGPCESREKKSCALGSQRHQRQCNNPPPNGDGKYCEGIKEKIEDCWFFIGCPVDLQPPLDLQVLSRGTGLFNVSWSSVPYGKSAVKYRIYKTIEGDSAKQIVTFHEDVDAVPTKKITSQRYWKIIDLKRYMSTVTFKMLAVRMSSLDYWKEESIFTEIVRSGAYSIDGAWSEWGHWSDCSTKCTSQKGTQERTRNCDNPLPSAGGKPCTGKNQEIASCIGIEAEC